MCRSRFCTHVQYLPETPPQLEVPQKPPRLEAPKPPRLELPKPPRLEVPKPPRLELPKPHRLAQKLYQLEVALEVAEVAERLPALQLEAQKSLHLQVALQLEVAEMDKALALELGALALPVALASICLPASLPLQSSDSCS